MNRVMFEDPNSDSEDERRAIERRRLQESKRKERIFDSRRRQIGVDVNALDKQVEEKKLQKQHEIEEDLKWGILKDLDDQASSRIDSLISTNQRSRDININKFRKTYQNCMHRKKLNEDHPQFVEKQSMTSLKFTEDSFTSEDWRKFQKRELRSWLDQQVEEQNASKKKLEEIERVCTRNSLKVNQQWLNLMKLEKEHRRRMKETTDKFNKLLALETKSKDTQVSMDTSYNRNMFGDSSTSLLGLNRIRSDHFKGFSKNQLQSIRQCQLEQIREKEILKLNEKAAMKKDSEFQRLVGDSFVSELERKNKETKKWLKKLSEENERAALELHLEKLSFHTNDSFEDFINKFNRSSR